MNEKTEEKVKKGLFRGLRKFVTFLNPKIKLYNALLAPKNLTILIKTIMK